MNFAKSSIIALLGGGLILSSVQAHAQQSQSSTSSPSEAGNVTPNTAVSPGPGASYRDAIGSRTGLGWNAATGIYQTTIPNTPQYQGVQPPVAVGSTAAPAPDGANTPAPAAAAAPAPSSITTPAAPPAGNAAPAPAQTAPLPSDLPYLRADYQRARQALSSGAYRDTADQIRSAAARLDQAIAAAPSTTATGSELIAARDALNELAARVERGRQASPTALNRAFDNALRVMARYQDEQARAASQAGAAPSNVPPDVPNGPHY